MIIGKQGEQPFQISDGFVSRRHCEITETARDGVFHIKDLGSSNGTFVNGSQVAECDVTYSDQITLGSYYTLNLRKCFEPPVFPQRLKTIWEEYQKQVLETNNRKTLITYGRVLPLSLIGFTFKTGLTSEQTWGIIIFAVILTVIVFIVAMSSLKKLSKKLMDLQSEFLSNYSDGNCHQNLGSYPPKYYENNLKCKCPRCGKIITTLLLLLFCGNIFAQNIYVVSVGVSNYQKLENLRYAAKDAKDIANYYKQKTKNVIILTSRYATKEMIVKSLEDQLSRATASDMVVFYYSGHGYDGGFCPYDINTSPNLSLSYTDIQDIFRKCNARRKIVFADACFSGGAIGKYSQVRGTDLEVLLFLACRGYEISIESNYVSNGYFTAFLINGLKGKADINRDGDVTAKELFDYVSRGVIYTTGGRQHPVMWGKFDENMILN
ncbi:MAG: caspase family protein [Bacteroidales bacterium]|nr:caspase family protein [Bacteroidales bacterium]